MKKPNLYCPELFTCPTSEAGDLVFAIFRKFLHKRSSAGNFQKQEIWSLPMGANLMEKLKVVVVGLDRIQLDGLAPPEPESKSSPMEKSGLTMKETKKLLRVAQLEAVRSKLQEVQKIWEPRVRVLRAQGSSSSCNNGQVQKPKQKLQPSSAQSDSVLRTQAALCHSLTAGHSHAHRKVRSHHHRPFSERNSWFDGPRQMSLARSRYSPSKTTEARRAPGSRAGEKTTLAASGPESCFLTFQKML
ncbi:hypothetical protein ACFX15_036125 [Malus domestica]